MNHTRSLAVSFWGTLKEKHLYLSSWVCLKHVHVCVTGIFTSDWMMVPSVFAKSECCFTVELELFSELQDVAEMLTRACRIMFQIY